jgi:type I restriction enzyme M protein
MMNLAIRGIECNLGGRNADSFHNDLHKDLKADFILANPPFNVSDWGGDRLREDVRWKYGTPPVGNANYAWVQHIIHHLAPHGVAGFVLANGSMSSNQSGEGDIRKAIIEADLVDCMIALPGQLFYTTQIPACLWFLARSKTARPFRHRKGETLFIDARKLGVREDRIHRILTDDEIAKIARTYHAWRGEEKAGEYRDVPGFCKSATLEEIKGHGYVLTPGRYVGAKALEDDDEPFEDKMRRLAAKLEEQFAEAARLLLLAFPCFFLPPGGEGIGARETAALKQPPLATGDESRGQYDANARDRTIRCGYCGKSLSDSVLCTMCSWQ